jgi:hypothetical protein
MVAYTIVLSTLLFGGKKDVKNKTKFKLLKKGMTGCYVRLHLNFFQRVLFLPRTLYRGKNATSCQTKIITVKNQLDKMLYKVTFKYFDRFDARVDHKAHLLSENRFLVCMLL